MEQQLELIYKFLEKIQETSKTISTTASDREDIIANCVKIDILAQQVKISLKEIHKESEPDFNQNIKDLVNNIDNPDHLKALLNLVVHLKTK